MKSPRDMILDRLAAAQIDINRLAVEAMANGVRVTGAVPNREELARIEEVLGDARAAGVNVSHRIEYQPAGVPQDDDSVDSKVGNPPEPA
jgi:post-segregation antitoxin (ccd killing protein)